MSSIPQTSGVYQISCDQSHKIYIGSSNNLARRWKEHRKMLRFNKHPNIHLQNAWNKYGESNFTFSVLELVLSAFVTEREQYWIDRTKCYDRKKGYNSSPTAENTTGYQHSAESRTAMAEGHNKAWEGFIDPNGHEVVITGLLNFCRTNGLSYSSMARMAYGSPYTLKHKGWTHVNAASPRQQFKDLSRFIRPDGTPEPTPQSIKELAQKYSLNWKSLYKLINGDYETHKGWRYHHD